MGKQIKKVSTHMEKLLASFKYFMGACLNVLPFLTQFFHLMHLKAHFQPLCKVVVCFCLEPPLLFK